MSRSQIRLRSPLRRCTDLLIGSLALILGAVLIFTPGPASLVIPVGLAFLGREFRWARQGNLVMRRKLRSLFNSNRRQAAVNQSSISQHRAPRAHFAFNH